MSNVEQIPLQPLTLYGYRDGKIHPITEFNLINANQRELAIEEIFLSIESSETQYITINNVMWNKDEFYMYQIL